MGGIIRQIEKAKPFFDKLAQNIYLGAIRDGFLTAMPAILFSSVFILAAAIPEIFGFAWPEEVSTWLWKVYGYTMGVVGLLVTATTARCLAESMNRKMPQNKKINPVSVMLASICGFLFLSVAQIDGNFSTAFMGTKGLIASFIAAFITCWVYRFCVKKDITIRMPKEVPGTISQMFRDIFPFSFAVLICVIIDVITTYTVGTTFAEAVITLLQPLFSAADGYLGICIIWGAMAMFWFVGVHGPSIVEPAIAAIIYANVETNLQLFKAGEHASNVLTVGLGNFVGTMGGTGATLVVPFLFMLFARSKQLKAVGKASFVPVCFAVNEPLLFATPIVLNPYFFVPFLLAPMVNVSIFKFFVDVLNMDSFMYVLPWATPAPVGLILGTGVSILAVVLAVVLIVVDSIIYLPFIKAYDDSLLIEEAQKAKELETMDSQEKTVTVEKVRKELTDNVNVLVLCVGAGTSAMFANAIEEGAKESGTPMTAQAGAYGSHYDILKNFDVVVLSPQVQSHLDEVKDAAKDLGIKVVATKGAQYIALTKDPKGAVNFILDVLEK
ncbi:MULTISPECIES: PTS transporter subunit EIIC [unclassified Breznakia]|uniref:PTS transporter subunit EIIC n=1 Tax=unclassified Breznakia TaxID=2623764 RepID=UPI0024741118|nr:MULTISPECIES: PTS transporter subunit EIIC [unclassified Breznakia]MDH6366947.1 PTS system lactose-specific IIC component [Breznakia sp. PH1-1]MDH6404125.1 PTS system lactose-specific IIC component [Breznakia sp. PF1-11]MDH6411834.1 PTS system lactose-specific IIC component [Breznakia sp. PFB1-11]MDH6414113.1 PTS system lactose-specific IIC component [Breznakia sp. PFB1-14]MDH6416530.1 PTS system lactose-specific IIC component [Breznakia sp. PFB1-4]